MLTLFLLEPIILICMFICIVGILVYLIRTNRNSKKNQYNWLLAEGNNYMEEGNYKSALHAYSKLVELKPDDATGYLLKGCALYKLKRYRDIINELSKSIELDPNNVEAYKIRANIYTDMGEFDKALSDTSTILELNPINPSAYNTRIKVYFKKKELDKALSESLKAIDLHLDNSLTYDFLSAIYIRLGDYEKSLESSSKAINLDNERFSAYKNHAYALIKLDKLDEAKEYIQKSINCSPGFGDTYIILSMINLIEKDLISFYENLTIASLKQVYYIDYFDDPIFDEVRNSKDFIEVYAKLKINYQVKLDSGGVYPHLNLS